MTTILQYLSKQYYRLHHVLPLISLTFIMPLIMFAFILNLIVSSGIYTSITTDNINVKWPLSLYVTDKKKWELEMKRVFKIFVLCIAAVTVLYLWCMV